jgi:hypothetical protein
MNCSELDLAVEGGIAAAQTDTGFGTFITAIGLLSIAMIMCGERIARPLAGIIAFGGVTLLLFGITGDMVFDSNLPCLPRVLVSTVGGLVCAVLAWCLLKGGLFVLGAASLGTVAHFVYRSVPIAKTHEPPFVIMGESGYYYITLGVAGLAGALLSIVMKKQIMRITTSLIGGGGLALTTHLVADRVKKEVPAIVLVFIMIVGTAIGVGAQHYLSKRHKRLKKKKRKAAHDADSE